MQYKKISTTLMVLCTFSMAGCVEPPPPQYLPNDTSLIALNQIAEKAQKSTAVLAEIQAKNARRSYTSYSRKGYRKTAQSENSSYVEPAKININFTGAVNEAVQKISKRAGYEFMTGINSPKSFPTIHLSENNASLSTIIDHINQQLPSQIKVISYPKTKSIVLVSQTTAAEVTGNATPKN